MTINLKGYWQDVKKRASSRIVLLGVLGVLGIMLLMSPGSCQPRAGNEIASSPNQAEPDHQYKLQKELERILKTIEGAGQVSVLLTLDDDQEVVYAWNTEQRERTVSEEDKEGGVREQLEYDERGQLVVVRNGGQEQPVVIKAIRPQVRGVLIVSSNADNALVRKRLVEAVQGALDVPAYKITIQKGR